MSIIFLVLEIFSYGFVVYLVLFKKELAIIYLPVILFIHNIITPALPSLAYYGTVSLLLLFLIDKNISFFKENYFALILVVLYGVLSLKSGDLVAIRPALFPVMWLFFSIPLIISIYKKHSRERIFNELTTSSFIILFIFTVNVIVSTRTGYAPNAMYGITSGILYGNLYATDFNILGIAVFIVMLKIINKRDFVYLLTFIISFSFIMLSLRRSVMGVSILGVAIILLILMSQKKLQKVIVFGSIGSLLSLLILMNTNFMNVFIERYERRKLEDRALEGEARFMEYELLYRDIFIYNEYSLWFGYELFNSGGNYGKGYFGDRTLHSDLTNITHSSGIIGVLLYLSMIITGFRKSFIHAKTRHHYLLILYCAIVFIVYTITGRYINVSTNIILFLLLMLPITKNEEVEKPDFSEPSKILKNEPQLV